jgi:hypothetical protein
LYRELAISIFLVPGGSRTGVITVLERANNWWEERQSETDRTRWQKHRIASKEAGITQVINDLSNPLKHD